MTLTDATILAAKLTDMSTTGEDFLAGDMDGKIIIERYKGTKLCAQMTIKEAKQYKWYTLYWLPKYYDKLLHVLVTFTLLVFGVKIFPAYYVAGSIIALQVLKVWLNKSNDKAYRVGGDACANAVGFVLGGLYSML